MRAQGRIQTRASDGFDGVGFKAEASQWATFGSSVNEKRDAASSKSAIANGAPESALIITEGLQQGQAIDAEDLSPWMAVAHLPAPVDVPYRCNGPGEV